VKTNDFTKKMFVDYLARCSEERKNGTNSKTKRIMSPFNDNQELLKTLCCSDKGISLGGRDWIGTFLPSPTQR
jgi:hypothetical protein